jgi:hypothetical protein
MRASGARLRLRLPDPVPSPTGLANAGFPSADRDLRFFLGVGEEGGGTIPQPIQIENRAFSGDQIRKEISSEGASLRRP